MTNLPLTPDVVLGQVQVRPVALVAGEHDGAPHVGVLQPQWVPDLVYGHLGQVDPTEAPEGPELVVVEVNVSWDATLLGEKGVGEGSTWFIKGVSIPMFSWLEPDNNKPWLGNTTRLSYLISMSPTPVSVWRGDMGLWTVRST